MAQYIEIIEIVEETSIILKIDDLKQSADLVQELQQSIAAMEAGEVKEEFIERIINKKQIQLAQKLQQALICLQSQIFESQTQCIPSISEKNTENLVKVVHSLQNDLVILTGPNVIVEKYLIDVPCIKEPCSEKNVIDESAMNKDQYKAIEVNVNNLTQSSEQKGNSFENKEEVNVVQCDSDILEKNIKENEQITPTFDRNNKDIGRGNLSNENEMQISEGNIQQSQDSFFEDSTTIILSDSIKQKLATITGINFSFLYKNTYNKQLKKYLDHENWMESTVQ